MFMPRSHTAPNAWSVRQRLTQPTSPPRTFRSKKGSFWKKSQYDSNVGSYTLELKKEQLEVLKQLLSL